MSGGSYEQPLLSGSRSESDSHYGSAGDNYQRPSLRDLSRRSFYQKAGWFERLCEALFKIRARNTTIQSELYNGVIHFISCLYCLAVVPQQLSTAKYDSNNTVVSVALCVGVGTIFCGLFANLPFVLAPPTVVTIFLAVFLQQYNLGPQVGNVAVVASGLLLMLMGWRPLAELVKRLIPAPIQVGTVVGVGLLTTLAGSTEIGFVITGHYKILRMGEITPEVVITFLGVIIICVALRFHVKGSFCIAVVVTTVMWWVYSKTLPSELFALPTVTTANFRVDENATAHLPLLTVDLLFLYVLYLNGLVTSLSNLAVLTREDGATPRGRWIFILSGLFTICGGLLTSAPILVSPESCAAIKEGAKTGLSAVVCGLLFLLAVFLGPLFEHIPAAGTSPVLIMIGLVLFQNVGRIDWRNVADAAPAFLVLFYIPFTYSIIQGVILGYVIYLAITLCTGELLENALSLYLFYFPQQEDRLMRHTWLRPYLLGHHSAYRMAALKGSTDESDSHDGSKAVPDNGVTYSPVDAGPGTGGGSSRRQSVSFQLSDIAVADNANMVAGSLSVGGSSTRRASWLDQEGAGSSDMDLHFVGMDPKTPSAAERRRSRAISAEPMFSTFVTLSPRPAVPVEGAADGGDSATGNSNEPIATVHDNFSAV